MPYVSPRRFATALLLVLLWALGAGWPTPALAQTLAAPSAEALERARALYESGTQHYREGAYEQAVRDYDEGYRLSGNPGFLFNIAQAERLLGACERALAGYRRYLELAPTARYRDEALTEAREMEACVARGQAQAPAPASAPPPPPPARASAAPPLMAPSVAASAGAGAELRQGAPPGPPGFSRSRTVAVGLASVGAAAGLGAAYFFHRAHSAGDRVEVAHPDGQRKQWTSKDQAAEREGQRANLVGIACLAASATALAAGAVVFVRSRGGATVGATAALDPGGGGLIGVVGSF
jgi:tetratricopeptide (TPR) repeat protein